MIIYKLYFIFIKVAVRYEQNLNVHILKTAFVVNIVLINTYFFSLQVSMAEQTTRYYMDDLRYLVYVEV